MKRTQTGAPPRQRILSPLNSDWLRITIMAGLLAVVVFIVFIYQPPGAPTNSDDPVLLEDETPPPQLDPKIMALPEDASRAQRLVIEPAPLEHLLARSLQVVPSVAAKLGIPEQPVPVAALRSNPERNRGRYLWYKGTLEYLSMRRTHPIDGYQTGEARIKTPDGEHVMFFFSARAATKFKRGDWVRVEGFFLKLRDMNLPVKLDLVPVLVGPELTRAFADWNAVEKIDPSVLAQVKDGRLANGQIVDREDMALTLDESQDDPLWHLASFAKHERTRMSPEQRAKIPAFVTAKQWRDFEFGRSARGTTVRLLGTFQLARSFAAKSNPLEIDTWTEAWVQSRDLSGRTVPIWIPHKLASHWRRNQPVEIVGYFYKRYIYKTWDGKEHVVPLFIAAEVDPFELPNRMLTNNITIGFAGIVSLVILILFVSARRDAKRRERHEINLVERRRRRRGVTTPLQS